MDTQEQQTSADNNGAATATGRKPHVVVVPYPAQGHMLPLLDLASLLAARGLAVSVAVTPGNAPLLTPLTAAFPSAVETVTLPFPSSHLLPEGCGGENTKDLPRHLFRPFMASLAPLRAPLHDWCKGQAHINRHVTAIISDFFTGWTRPLAGDLGVPHVTFSPSCALHLATSHSLWRRLPTTNEYSSSAITFTEIPGAPSFPLAHVSGLFRQHVPGDEVSEAIRQIFLWNLESTCFVVNSFAALEPAYVQARTLLPDLTSKREKPTVAAADVAAWLDTFPDDGSVVYASFGTQHAPSPAQASCVARALALSSAPFVWAVRAGTVLPPDFESSSSASRRGMVIRGWAPQAEVLRHRAVGWFLTHCGWNSALEAAAAGVAVLAWPMGADQFAGARMLAEAGVAVPVAGGADAVPDSGEVAEVIARAVVGEEGKAVRERAAELGRKARDAVAEGGSSRGDLDELVQISWAGLRWAISRELLTDAFHSGRVGPQDPFRSTAY